MDLRVVASTFVAVFLAELGDKTQVAVLTLGAGSTSRWSVFAGAALALACSSLVAILVADQLATRIDVRWTRGIAGVLLVAMGIFYVVGSLRSPS